MARVVYIVFFVSFLLNCTNSQNEEENFIVEISNGKIKGRLTYTLGQHKVYYAFQGIPYAEPPVDDLRFRPPVPANSWPGILKTTEDEKKCIQGLTAGSEDCLYINVFTPNFNGSKLPVMVWIYGGYFFQGDSEQENFGPDYFIENEVVIVTFNYRLGVFGFLSTEDSASPGNYALKDQILALKWVQENIACFGGDPGKVTIFGESAGAASVAYLLQTSLTKNLFHGAIMQSGTSLNTWALSRNPRDTAAAIGKILLIDTRNSTLLVNALRRIEAKTLQSVSISTDLVQTIVTNPLNGIVFGPCLEPDALGAVVTKRSHEMLNRGEFNKVPCIIGFNSEEGVSLKKLLDLARPYYIFYDFFASRLIPIDMNIQRPFQIASVGFSIRKKYFGLVPITLADHSLIRFVTDDLFVRPIHEYVSVVAKFNPVFYYRFSYEGDLGVNGYARSYRGVGHAEDLKYLWEKKEITVNPSLSDLNTRNRLVKLWTNFAKTGNPTPVSDPLFDNILWPTSYFKNLKYLDIGKNFSLVSDFENYNIQFWTDLYNSNGHPPYDTY